MIDGEEDTAKEYVDSVNSISQFVDLKDNIGPGGSKLILNDTVKKKP